MLRKDYFLLCQSVILSVLSHEEIYLNICKNMMGILTFVILFTNPSARAGYDTRSIFKRSLTGLNSEFSFS